MFSSRSLLDDADSTKGGRCDIRQFLSHTAERLKLFIVAGSLPLLDADSSGRSAAQGKVFTSSLVYSPAGKELARYDKLHLFDVSVDDKQGSYRESSQFEAGDQAVVVELPKCKLGLSICYDLRFPALYQYLRSQGAEVLLVPAAFTYNTGEAHWLPLLRARAIENQCYVIAANQGGQHSEKTQYLGAFMHHQPLGRGDGKPA